MDFQCMSLSYKYSVTVSDLKARITTAARSVNEDMFRCVCNELYFSIGIYRVTTASVV
jgi:hypothetical protein